MPFADVTDPSNVSPLANVVVPIIKPFAICAVEVAINPLTVVVPAISALPWTLNKEEGEVVPIPSRLLNQSTTKVFPSTVNPPLNVEVAVVEVASM